MMQNNNNVAVNNSVEPEKPSFGKRLWLGIKEWCRKFIVNLKRRPMNVAFLVLIVSTMVNLCYLGSYSQLGLLTYYSKEMQGMCIFVNTLFGILSIMLFMNAFPKRAKKPNLVMLILTFAFMAVLIGLDIYLYVKWGQNHVTDLAREPSEEYLKTQLNICYFDAMTGVMVHMILVAVAAVLTATYPLFGKLINKINTKVNLESTELKEAIDTSAEV